MKYVGPYIKNTTRTKLKRAVSWYNDLKNSVTSNIKNFANSSFIESSRIEKLLNGLKLTTEKDNQVFGDLSQQFLWNEVTIGMGE